ncbi:zinc finger protein 808-like isoform X1 [Schistocerca piceifrons]|uniref:zinc finger protein 808-like isoform X1 n=1 Tax=Schistocerca piceifrons TaxID=274613 RepID=UPI001F5EFBB0|nr:zinc finger protein 808-like isoform X1 [Schistocerca piceifrons]
MESTGEKEAVPLCSRIDIKEEPIPADPYEQPESEDFYIEEGNKVEISEDDDVYEPIKVKKEACLSEEETTSPLDAAHIKKEPELKIEVEPTSCGSDQESNKPAGVGPDGTGSGGSLGRTTKQEAFCEHESDAQHLARSCNICRKTPLHLQDPKEHKQVTNGLNSFACSVCHKRFKGREHLKKHSLLHSERPYKCDVCGKAFRHCGTLKMHSRRHTMERPYVCEVCHKAFKVFGSFESHSRLHATECVYFCKVCHKTFKCLGNTKRHSCVPKIERPYVCSVCHKKFKTVRELRRHSRVHKRERPCIRNVCRKKFTGSNALKKQPTVRVNKGPQSCDVCQRIFPCRSKLREHSRVHTGERPFSCGVCPKAFKRRSCLKRHMGVHRL